MGREDLLDIIEEELKVSSEMGHEFRHIAKNIVAIVKGEKEHLDYDHESHQYEWDKP